MEAHLEVQVLRSGQLEEEEMVERNGEGRPMTHAESQAEDDLGGW